MYHPYYTINSEWKKGVNNRPWLKPNFSPSIGHLPILYHFYAKWYNRCRLSLELLTQKNNECEKRSAAR